MQMNRSSNINMVVFHDHFPIAVCKPEHLGFVGVFFKNLDLYYPVGTPLEVEFLGSDDDYTDTERVEMVVNNSASDGTGLRLKNFKQDNVNKWQSILSDVFIHDA